MSRGELKDLTFIMMLRGLMEVCKSAADLHSFDEVAIILQQSIDEKLKAMQKTDRVWVDRRLTALADRLDRLDIDIPVEYFTAFLAIVCFEKGERRGHYLSPELQRILQPVWPVVYDVMDNSDAYDISYLQGSEDAIYKVIGDFR